MDYLAHYGVGHKNGGHSGRYDWGSGSRPFQSLEGVFSKKKKKKKEKDTVLQNATKKTEEDVEKAKKHQEEVDKIVNDYIDATKETISKAASKKEDEAINKVADEVSKDKDSDDKKETKDDKKSKDKDSDDKKDKKDKKNSVSKQMNNIDKTGNNLVRGAQTLNKTIRQFSRASNTEDLSKKTDQELISEINRMNLETRYYQAKANSVTKGQAKVDAMLGTVGGMITVGTSAVSLMDALSGKEESDSSKKKKAAKKLLKELFD
jgi:hypothetical protein